MIKLKNEKENKLVNLEAKPPVYLYYSFILFIVSMLLIIVGIGSIILKASSMLLIVGSIESKKEGNFDVFYKIPLIMFVIEVVILILIIITLLLQIPLHFLTLDSILAIILITLAIFLFLFLIRGISMGYNVFNGRKKEMIKYLNNGFIVSNMNELNEKELKLINKVNKKRNINI